MNVCMHHCLASRTAIIQADAERLDLEAAHQVRTNARNEFPYAGHF